MNASSGDFRSEVQTRVANFRKHQERFEREREELASAAPGNAYAHFNVRCGT